MVIPILSDMDRDASALQSGYVCMSVLSALIAICLRTASASESESADTTADSLL